MSGAIEITSHDEIRRWAEERGGKPAHLKPGVPCIDFGDVDAEEIDWETWFDELDEAKLALVVEEETGQGELNRSNELVPRHESIS